MVVALVLISALLHAGWNALLRLEPDKDDGVVLAIAVAAAVALIAGAGRSALGGTTFPTVAALGWTLAAGVIEAAYFAALARALALGPLGVVYTISRGATVPIVWAVSALALGEPVGALAVAGSAVVVLGLVLAGGGGGASVAAVAWASGCAVAIAAYHLAYKAALAAGGNPTWVFAISLTLAAALGLLARGRTDRRRLGAVLAARWRRLLPTGALCAVAFLVFVEGWLAAAPASRPRCATPRCCSRWAWRGPSAIGRGRASSPGRRW
ncbi:MAG: hypothetical protein R2939_09665 [Kofleriaceae bacterium]